MNSGIMAFYARTMEDNRRKSTSVPQIELLIKFMEEHKNLAIGQLRSKEGRALARRLWEQCAKILNSAGVTRTPKDWSKFWTDYKCRVRAKVAEINRSDRATGGGPSVAPELSPLEERVVNLLGRDYGPISGVRQDPEIQIEIIKSEDMEELELQLESPPEVTSPTLDIALIQESTGALDTRNSSPATLELSRTVTLETPPIATEGHNQPDVRSTTPLRDQSRTRRPRKIRRRGHPCEHSNTAALDEMRAAIARIEEMRARTDEMMAITQRNMSQAALNMSEALTSIAESLHTYLSGGIQK